MNIQDRREGTKMRHEGWTEGGMNKRLNFTHTTVKLCQKSVRTFREKKVRMREEDEG